MHSVETVRELAIHLVILEIKKCRFGTSHLYFLFAIYAWTFDLRKI